MFLNVEQRNGGSRHIPTPAPELVYPAVSGVGVDISALEDPVVVVPCVMRAGHRSDRHWCAIVAARYPRDTGRSGCGKSRRYRGGAGRAAIFGSRGGWGPVSSRAGAVAAGCIACVLLRFTGSRYTGPSVCVVGTEGLNISRGVQILHGRSKYFTEGLNIPQSGVHIPRSV